MILLSSLKFFICDSTSFLLAYALEKAVSVDSKSHHLSQFMAAIHFSSIKTVRATDFHSTLEFVALLLLAVNNWKSGLSFLILSG